MYSTADTVYNNVLGGTALFVLLHLNAGYFRFPTLINLYNIYTIMLVTYTGLIQLAQDISAGTSINPKQSISFDQ